MKPKMCQIPGNKCIWGKPSGTKIVCAFSRCIIEDEDENRSRRELERMMSSHDTYERRGGKVRQRGHGQQD